MPRIIVKKRAEKRIEGQKELEANKEIEENHWTGERDLSLFLCLAPRRTPMPNPISIFSQDPEADVGTASRTGITDPTHALVLFYSVFFARCKDKKR